MPDIVDAEVQSFLGSPSATAGLGIRTSTAVEKLFSALAKAQGEFTKATKDSANPYFKSSYADLASVVDATRPHLAKNELAILQSPRSGIVDGQKCVILTTMLVHSSGQWMADDFAVPVKGEFTAQSVGSAVTYARRYAMQSFLGVAPTEDDGNAASGKETSKTVSETNEEFDQRTSDQQCIAIFQVQAIDEACKRSGKTEEEILAYLGLIGHKRIEHILKSEFQDFLKWANATAKPNPTPPAIPGLKPASKIGRTPQVAMKHLFATANELQIPEGDVKRAAYEKFGVESMTKLSAAQLDEMTQWVRDVAQAVAES